MSAVPNTLPRTAVDLGCVVEQLHRTGRDAESAEFAFALARRVKRGDPFVLLTYYSRLWDVDRGEIANLCTINLARALLADRAAVVEALESAGRDWEDYYA